MNQSAFIQEAKRNRSFLGLPVSLLAGVADMAVSWLEVDRQATRAPGCSADQRSHVGSTAPENNLEAVQGGMGVLMTELGPYRCQLCH